MSPPVSLVGDSISHDVEEALQKLLAMSRRKQNRLIGIAFAAIVVGPEKRETFTNAAGELYRSPIFARGVVDELHDALGELSRGHVPQGWQE